MAERRIGVYHEVCPERIDQVLRDGIRCGGAGEKTAAAEKQADAFLDAHVPTDYAERGLSRRHVVFAYLPIGDRLIDIKNGECVEVRTFASRREQRLVRIDIERTRCYISDLDCYDIVKEALNESWPAKALQRWATRYWAAVTPLDDYVSGQVRRPEVMVIGDVSADAVTVVPVG